MKCTPPPKKAISFYGNSDIQKAARKVFPILIELATDSTRPTITYGELAKKIGLKYMPGKLKNPQKSLDGRRAQWMRLPLGSIWKTLFNYQQKVDFDIPYLMTIVINQQSRLPTIFKTYCNWSYEKIKSEQNAVYKFKRWAEVKDAICKK